MSQKNKKQFGVWMDTHQAIIIGREDPDTDVFTVVGAAGDAGANNSENTDQDGGKTSRDKFFKEILSHMTNAEEVHVTGTGTSQEQFINYMAGSPQFKNTVAKESTSNKMSEENLAAYISEKFN